MRIQVILSEGEQEITVDMTPETDSEGFILHSPITMREQAQKALDKALAAWETMND